MLNRQREAVRSRLRAGTRARAVGGQCPGPHVNTALVTILAEIAVDVSEEFPKPLTDEVVRAADVVVSMACGDACPVYPGKRYREWDLHDPSDHGVEGARAVRDEMRGRLRPPSSAGLSWPQLASAGRCLLRSR